MTGPAISVSGVTKRYGTLAAVNQVSLEVGTGEVYALLGLNGAGKTTLIRMLLGMVRPTAGSLGLAGRPVTDRSVWAEVGYLVETPSAYPDLTVRENLDVARRLRRLPTRSVVDDAVDRFGLGAVRRLEGTHAVAGQRAAARAGQGAAAPAPDPGAGRTGQRPGPGRCRGGPRPCSPTSPVTTGSPSCCPATCWARWRGSRPGSASSTTVGSSRSWTAPPWQASTRTRLEVVSPRPRQGGVHPAGRRVRGRAARRRHLGAGGPGGRSIPRRSRRPSCRGRRAAHEACRGGRGPRGPLHAARRPPHRRHHRRHPVNRELPAAVGAELVKVRRAVMLWATGIAFLVAALVGGVLHVRAAGPGPGPVAGPAGRQGAAQRRHRRLGGLLRAPRADGRRRRDAAVRDGDDLAVRS